MYPKIKNQFGFELTAIWGSKVKVSRGKIGSDKTCGGTIPTSKKLLRIKPKIIEVADRPRWNRGN
jgi:hypothetical protein